MKNLLIEKSRGELIDKSRNAAVTKSYGTTRYERRHKQHILNTIETFNDLDMNALFKSNVLVMRMPVRGETDDYEVDVVFDNIAKDIQRELKKSRYILEYKVIHKAIIRAINNQDIYLGCTCNDWKYRFAYIATKSKFNAGKAQLVPARITNPDDSKGAGCKHVLNVIGNLDWAMKLATAILNYINVLSEQYPDKYREILFPAVYGMPYDYAVKKGIIQEEEPEDELLDIDIEDESDIEDLEDDVLDADVQEEPQEDNLEEV